MALISAGVEVDIIDESFYASGGPGTVPLVVIATAANKTAPSGVGIAPNTVAGVPALYLATSQRDLIQNYGAPLFTIVEGTPIHGDELNEYGLHAAYQYLGISNRCYILRANIDLSQLVASTSAPVAPAVSGTYWFDTGHTAFGVFLSNGNANSGLAWTAQTPLVANSGSVTTVDGVDVPSSSLGTNGQFAVVVTMSNNLLYEKISGSWYAVGTTAWATAKPTKVTGSNSPSNVQTTDSISINGTPVVLNVGTGTVANVVTAINNASISHITAAVVNTALVITNTVGGNIVLANANGTPLATLGFTAGTTHGVTFSQTNTPQYPTGTAAGSVWIKGSIPNLGAKWVVKIWNAVTGTWITSNAPFYPFNSGLSDGNASKDTAATAAYGNTVAIGSLYVGYDTSDGAQQLRRWNGTMWVNLVYQAGVLAPTSAPAAGTYWYNANLSVDIMYGTGSKWQGYANKYPDTDPNGVIIAGSAPTTQSGGGALVDNDIWLDSSDLEHYPLLYKYNATYSTWNLIDNTDQTSPFGIIFADARENSGTTFTNIVNGGSYTYLSALASDMALSDFVDPDAPDARTYPDGMLLFNTRYSTYNVKVWTPNLFTPYVTYTNSGNNAIFPALTDLGRWVTASGNQVDGSPYMGRKAKRAVIVRAMEAVLEANQDIRSELIFFNLIAAPGYPELMPEMVTLNTDQKEVAFIVGDTPARLTSSATDITKWATNANDVAVTGENGLTIANDYIGVYYPWGMSNDLSGNNVMIPPSTIALSTIAYSDQVSYPWYAPAGFQRGIVTNASSVGYLGSDGEYKPVILNSGQRDVLYSNKINPIAYIPGRGLVVYGQKTLNPISSALDRVNVARLVNYIKYNLDNIVLPFLFELNTEHTRAAAQALVSSFFDGLVGLQGITDYAVVCDLTNNTPTRIDANELWIDCAIIPTKAIEFIYIPVRILNTGASLTA